MSDKLALIRLGLNVVSAIGVSKVVNDIIVNNTTVMTTADVVKVWTGSLVIGSMVADVTSRHINQRMDDVLAWNAERKEVVAEVKAAEATGK